jgi:hypothetical protein
MLAIIRDQGSKILTGSGLVSPFLQKKENGGLIRLARRVQVHLLLSRCEL